MILVVSHPDDDHAMGVLEALARVGHPVVMVDTGRFPVEGSLSERFGAGSPAYALTIDGQPVDLASCRVGWWRRPRPFTLHPGISPDVASFAYTESHEAIVGLWAALDIVWVNEPALDEAAHHKPYQLAVAHDVGLPIPRTLISNDPDAVRDFERALHPAPVIYKTFLASEQHWRETRVLRAEDLELLDQVRLAPAIFQEYVPAVADVRVTVLGERLFATDVITAPGGYEYDYRMDLPGATFSPTVLPASTERMILALMRRLGLRYGAIDLRRKPDGTHVFLEVNPAGEWRFVEERTNQPITEGMADYLIGIDVAASKVADRARVPVLA